jgi:hypothetical protein
MISADTVLNYLLLVLTVLENLIPNTEEAYGIALRVVPV